jgi:hypothetical protein
LPEDELWARYAHRFTIYVYVDDSCDAEVIRRVVDRIVEVNKPAHTSHSIQAIFPHARLGVQSRVGLDLVLGAAKAPATRLGDGGQAAVGNGGPSGVLGVDSVLGARRPEYVRRLEREL